MPAAGLVRLPATDHDYGGVVAGWAAVQQPLVAARSAPADHAYGVELIDEVGNGHQLRHGAEGLASEVGVRAGEDHARAPRREGAHERDDSRIEKLCLVDGDDVRVVAQILRDLQRRIDGHCLYGSTVVARDGEHAAVPIIEMRLEDLNVLLRDDRSAH